MRNVPWWPAGIMLAAAFGFEAAAWWLGETEFGHRCRWCRNLWLLALAGDVGVIALLSLCVAWRQP